MKRCRWQCSAQQGHSNLSESSRVCRTVDKGLTKAAVEADAPAHVFPAGGYCFMLEEVGAHRCQDEALRCDRYSNVGKKEDSLDTQQCPLDQL